MAGSAKGVRIINRKMDVTYVTRKHVFGLFFISALAVMLAGVASYSYRTIRVAAEYGGAFVLNAMEVSTPVSLEGGSSYTRIFYYVEGTNARQSFFAHPGSIDVIAPQTYSINSQGAVSGRVAPDVLAFAHGHGIRVMPLVTNGNFDKSISATFLDNPVAQEAAIADFVSEAEQNGYWGWQIDFEQIDVSFRDEFSAFIRKVADTLHKHNLALSVAVVAQASQNPADYPNDLWQNVIGAYDYSALASNADFVSVMSYDDPFSKGPIAEYGWLERVIEYGAPLISPRKFSLGLGFYYWQWDDQTGKHIGTGGREGMAAVEQNHPVNYHYSSAEEAPYLTYSSRGKTYTIWYENAQSIAAKVDLIKKYGLNGFSAWALGLEVPSVYASMNNS